MVFCKDLYWALFYFSFTLFGLAHTLRKHTTPILFADYTSIIISSTNENEFKNDLSFFIN
jgi:hypothetical protein